MSNKANMVLPKQLRDDMVKYIIRARGGVAEMVKKYGIDKRRPKSILESGYINPDEIHAFNCFIKIQKNRSNGILD